MANLTRETRRVRIVPEILRGPVRYRMLDAGNAEFAMSEPERYRNAANWKLLSNGDVVELSLPPYAFARVSAERGEQSR